MNVRTKFSTKIKNKKINRFIIFGSVILFSSCEKHTDNTKICSKEDSVQFVSDIPKIQGLSRTELMDYVKSSPTIETNQSSGIPFSTLDYDKIIAYDFKGDEELYDAPINEQGNFIPIIEKQQFLSQEQADKILTALAKKSSYGEASAACFNPHLGLVFFKDNKKVNQISICLDCNGSISEIDIPARRHRVFNKGTDDEYSFTGFTPQGKAAVAELCRAINFYYKSADSTKAKK
ncbi:hypothetical protein QX233_09060 [Chryseobacterium gambrini]|uniref:Lipoprotein n=1 Tax=Chryseobacterium gambrini TaxID=373672 RepID=A0AAJ1VKB7_9FLAO|nr:MULTISPECIES: hypothetical protein [Chryseobacterium]MDN4012606.1 hypothetical protein [Chryseobacterium gambrini]QWA38500.1 hypothetical protein KKI44_21955 [Chryseobacterium sp. ZHDP1]